MGLVVPIGFVALFDRLGIRREGGRVAAGGLARGGGLACGSGTRMAHPGSSGGPRDRARGRADPGRCGVLALGPAIEAVAHRFLAGRPGAAGGHHCAPVRSRCGARKVGTDGRSTLGNRKACSSPCPQANSCSWTAAVSRRSGSRRTAAGWTSAKTWFRHIFGAARSVAWTCWCSPTVTTITLAAPPRSSATSGRGSCGLHPCPRPRCGKTCRKRRTAAVRELCRCAPARSVSWAGRVSKSSGLPKGLSPRLPVMTNRSRCGCPGPGRNSCWPPISRGATNTGCWTRARLAPWMS